MPRYAGPDRRQVHQLAIYAVAGTDGLFIAKEIGGDSVDLLSMFALHGRALHGMVSQMIAEQPRGRR